MSIGKVAELSDTLDVDLALRTRKAFYQKNSQGFYIENANGVDRECFHINGENQLHIGHGGYQHGDMPTMIDGDQIFLTANYDIVVNKGAIFNGAVVAGGKAKMWSDGEGGQFYLLSPNNVEWSMDAHDDHFRLYYIKDGVYGCPLRVLYNGNTEVIDLWADTTSKETHIGFVDGGEYGAFLYSKPTGGNIRVGLYDNKGQGAIWHVTSGNIMYNELYNTFEVGLNVPHGKRMYFGDDGYIYCSGGQALYMAASKESIYSAYLGVWDNSWTFCPNNDAHLRLGSPNCKWGNIYSSNATISTSDRNLKKEIQPLTDKHLKFFTMLQPVSFQFIDGTSGRTHIGFISQDVEDTMTVCGLTDLDFAGFCKDQKTERVEKIIEVKKEVPKEMIDETTGETYIGTEIVVEEQTIEEDVPVEGEYIYSLRYEEFIGLVTQASQHALKKIEVLEDRMNEFEKRFAMLESK